METQKRESWGSSIGFILAIAGSAVGLGNVWKFPYITGLNGGGAFVLVYLFCILLVGMPVMLCEIVIGRRTRKNPYGAFKALQLRRSRFADIIGGYMHWAGFTLLIKGLEGLICGLIVKKLNKKDKFYIDILGLVAAGVWMIVGYYFAGAILYGWAGSLESLPGNCIQGGVSIVVAYMLYAILKRMSAVQGFIERLNEPMFVKKHGEATDDNEQPESIAADTGNADENNAEQPESIVDTGNTDENNAEQPDEKSNNPSDK